MKWTEVHARDHAHHEKYQVVLCKHGLRNIGLLGTFTGTPTSVRLAAVIDGCSSLPRVFPLRKPLEEQSGPNRHPNKRQRGELGKSGTFILRQVPRYFPNFLRFVTAGGTAGNRATVCFVYPDLGAKETELGPSSVLVETPQVRALLRFSEVLDSLIRLRFPENVLHM